MVKLMQGNGKLMYVQLTEDQVKAGAKYAMSKELAVQFGENYVQPLPTDEGAPEWTPERLAELEAVLTDGE